jgi:MOSC domain-containing protein YiiM
MRRAEPVAHRAATVRSVNVAQPTRVERGGVTLTTAFFKRPVAGRVKVEWTHLEGDGQANRSVHGGASKAVYAYPADHYAFWAEQLPGTELPWGSFGENLTIAGLHESEVRIGDALRIGTSRLRVTAPRFPCRNLNFRFEREDMVRRFSEAARSGFYLSVVERGELGAGDAVSVEPGEGESPTVRSVFLERLKRDAEEGGG